jgi:chromosome segregation ATPase
MMFLEQKIETILASLQSIEDKVDRLMAESEVVRADLASLKGNNHTTEKDLKEEFSDFKERWESDSPEVQTLKDTLVKLKNSLGGITEALTQSGQAEKEELKG